MVRSRPYLAFPNLRAWWWTGSSVILRAHRVGEDRDKAVHLPVETKSLQRIVAVGLEGAAVIVQVNAGHPRDQSIGNIGRNGAGEFVVLAVLAPAADQVIAFIQLVEQHGDIGRVVLQIGIQQDDDTAARVVDPGGDGGGLPEIAAEDHCPRMLGIRLDQPLQHIHAAIGRAVIDKNDLPVPVQGLQRGTDGFHQKRKVLFFVIDRDDKGKLRHGIIFSLDVRGQNPPSWSRVP